MLKVWRSKTFTDRENLRNFLFDYQERKGPLSQFDVEKQGHTFNLDEMPMPIMFQEPSFDAAKSLLHDLHLLQNLSPEVKHAIAYGVPIGKIREKVLPDATVADIARFFRQSNIIVEDMPNIVMSVKHLAIRDSVGVVEKFSRGTVCKIGSADEDWIIEIADIFQVGPVTDKYFIFVNGNYFIPTLNNGNIIYHPWTQTPQFISRNYVRNAVQPACKIQRKVMMYPDPSDLEDPTFYLCIDFKNPELVKEVNVPVYPQVGETICIKGVGNQNWFGLVQQVNNERRTTSIKWYSETRRPGVWVLINQEDEVHFASIVRTCQVNRAFGGYHLI